MSIQEKDPESMEQGDSDTNSITFSDDNDLNGDYPTHHIFKSKSTVKVNSVAGSVNVNSDGNVNMTAQSGRVGLGRSRNVTINVHNTNIYSGANLHMDAETSARVAKENVDYALALMEHFPDLNKHYVIKKEKVISENRKLKRSNSLPDLIPCEELSAKRLLQKMRSKVAENSQHSSKRPSGRVRSQTTVTIQADSAPDGQSCGNVSTEFNITSYTDFRRSPSQIRGMNGGQAMKRCCGSCINPVRFVITAMSLAISVALIYVLLWHARNPENSDTDNLTLDLET